MEEMAAARFNIYWYLSLIVPAAVMLIATYRHKRSTLASGALLSVIAVYLLCNIAVQTKWRARFEMAKTEQEIEYASADGANLAFTALLIAPFEAALYTTFWGVIGWRLWPRIRGRNAANTL